MPKMPDAPTYRERGTPDSALDAADWVSLAALYVGLGALDEVLDSASAGAEAYAKILPEELEARREEAIGLLRLNRNSMKFDHGIELLLQPVAEAAKLRLKTVFTTGLTGNSLGSYDRRTKLLSTIFDRLLAHRGAVDSVFSGPDRNRLLKVISASVQTDPLARLRAVAAVPTPGAYSKVRRWAIGTAASCGNPIDETEIAAADAAEAESLAARVADLDRAADAADPGTEKAATIGETRASVAADLDRAIRDSVDPTVTRAAAVAKLNDSSPYRTKVAAAIPGGLVPDQEECVLARGKVVIAAGAGSGKCVTGDTLVTLPSGTYRIEDLSGSHLLRSVDAETLTPSIEIGQWLDMGTSKVFEVETRSGLRLRGTPEHPLLTWNGSPTWSRLGTMKPGERLLLQPGAAIGTGSSTVDPEEAYLFGLFMGDGWCSTSTGAMNWSRSGDDLPPHFYRLGSQFWGISPVRRQTPGTNSVTHEFYSVKLKAYLADRGMSFNNARNKFVAPWIFSASDLERVRFLQGLFDTDGSAYGRTVEWSTASERFAREVQQLALGLGAVGFLRPKKVRGYEDHTYWSLYFTGDQLRNFRERIGFRYEKKKVSRLDRICEFTCNPNAGTYPHVGPYFHALKEDWKRENRWAGGTQSLLIGEKWTGVSDYLKGKRDPSRGQILRLIGESNLPEAQLLRNLTGFYPDEVVAIRELNGEHRVYDFTVPTTHSFIANGIVSHNTRVLASKVVYHLQEMNLRPDQILAVSFSIRSAGELKERVLAYAKAAGLDLDENGWYRTWGTTHGTARNVLNESGVYRVSASPKAKPEERAITDSEISALLKCAIAQVKMKGGVGKDIPNEDRTFFPKLPPVSPFAGGGAPNALTDVKAPVPAEVSPPSPLEFLLADPGLYGRALRTVRDTLASRANSLQIRSKPVTVGGKPKTVFTLYLPNASQFRDRLDGMRINGERLSFKPSDKWDRADRFEMWQNGVASDSSGIRTEVEETLNFDRMREAATVLSNLLGKKPADLSADERSDLTDILTQPSVATILEPMLSAVRTAASAAEKAMDAYEADKDSFSKNSEKSPFYYWFNNPAGQWFNLGAPDSAFEVPGKGKNDKPRPAPLGTYKRFIGLAKSRLTAPGAAYSFATGGFTAAEFSRGTTDDDEAMDEAKAGDDLDPEILSAVYGAAEWLKKQVAHLRGRLDFDDLLIQSSRVLIENPSLLKRLQAQYRCILVDEAQDLNKCQHLLFGLLAGHIDPATLAPREDGKMTADTLAFVGDDKQCVAEGTEILTPEGRRAVETLAAGDRVLSYRNGAIVEQTLRHVVRSGWTRGRKVTLESGRTLTMSPNHRLWATAPRTEEGEMVCYLMYRRDRGFRVGITNKGKVGNEDYNNSYGARAFSEKAERLWVLDIVPSRDEALFRETEYTLRYGIPQTVFEGTVENDGSGPYHANQERIERIFRQFGGNGARLLEDRNLSFDHPHWMSQSYSKHGRVRNVVALLAHSSGGNRVTMEWSGDRFDGCLEPVTKVEKLGTRRRIGRYFRNYRDALKFAETVARVTEGTVRHRLSVPDGSLLEMTASGLFAGMSLPVSNDRETVELEKIVSIEEVEGGSYWDLDVDDASNFFGNDILTHNSIYEFRGAVPDEFIAKSDLGPTKGEFRTLLLKTNYRSGNTIVDAANKLISHNAGQIPMVCDAHPSRGEGAIRRENCTMAEDGPKILVSRIEADLAEARANGEVPKKFFRNYGFAARTNKEIQSYAMALLEAGIPFRSKGNVLGGPAVGPTVALFRLFSTSTPVVEKNDSTLKGMRAPDFGMSPDTVGKKLSDLRAGNYYEWLREWENGGAKTPVYGFARMDDRLRAYAKYLGELENLASKGTSLSMLDYIVAYRTPEGSNFGEQLALEVRNDPEALEELRAEAEENGDGTVTPEMLVSAALSPLLPLRKVAERFPKPADFVSYLESLGVRNAKNVAGEAVEEADVVTLDTVHGWKGLETDHLYVPMYEGHFPHFRSSTVADLESERRLAYVAITRGRSSVTVIEPTMKEVGDKVVPINPSRFMDEACIRGPVKKGGNPVSESEQKFRELADAYRAEAEVAELERANAEGAKTASPRRARLILPDWDFVDRTGSVPAESIEPATDLLAAWGDFLPTN